MYDYFAYIGGFFYLVCYMPQIYEIWHKKTNKINTPFISIQLFGAIFMTIYAYFNNLLPILCLNSCTMVFILIILYGIFTHDKIEK